MLQPRGNCRLGGAGIDAATNFVRTSVQPVLQAGFVQSTKRITQLGRCVALRRTQSALGVLHFLFELSQILRRALAIVGQLALLLALGSGGSLTAGLAASAILRGLSLRRLSVLSGLAGLAVLPVLAEGVAHAFRLGLLLLRQTLRFTSQFIHLSGSLLLVQPAEQIGGFAEPVGGAASIGVTLALRCGAAHVVVSLTQTV